LGLLFQWLSVGHTEWFNSDSESGDTQFKTNQSVATQICNFLQNNSDWVLDYTS
jgi:hypothetical protein